MEALKPELYEGFNVAHVELVLFRLSARSKETVPPVLNGISTPRLILTLSLLEPTRTNLSGYYL
jgi:hypothetical protein